jgi:hypothetical protein
MTSPFQPYRSRAAASGAPPSRFPAATPVSAVEFAGLRRTTLRLSRSFAAANAVFLGVMVLLACTADGLLGTEVVGRLNLGMLLGLAEGVLLLGTATWFDRASKLPDRAAGRLADRTVAWDADGQERGDASADAWPAEPPVGHRPAQAQHLGLQDLPSEQLYQRWDSYLFGGDRPDVRPSGNGPVGR